MGSVQINPILIAETFCHNPTAPEIAAIVALILGLGIVGASSFISVLGLVSTLIPLILSGATFETIGAAIAVHLGNIATSTPVVAAIYQGVKNILGC